MQLEASALPRLIEQMGIEGGQAEFTRRMEAVQYVLGLASGATQPTVGQLTKSSGAQGSASVSLG